MPIKSTQNTLDVYTITSPDGQTRASFVPEKGGVGSSIIMSWQNRPRELLYQHDNFWDRNNKDLPGGWPFIFPICARIAREGTFGNYLYDGEIYNLPIHGFASAIPWQVTKATANNRITLTLTENSDTLKCYPFHFRIDLEYVVENNKFICNQTYTNTGAKPIPYYGGFHPYFLTPPANQGKEKVMLTYKPARRFRYNEHLTDLAGTQKLFDLPASISDPVINEQLVELGNDKLITLTYPDGCKINMLAAGAKGGDENLFPYVQLYTQPTEPFICVEPWMGFPNALNSVAGSRWLKPGKSEHGILQLWLL